MNLHLNQKWGFFLLLALTGVPAIAAPPAACGTLNAGLQILTGIPTPGSNYAGSLKMAVWYPTSAAASTYKYSGPGNGISGLVAMDAPVAGCAKFPLIVFSHGWSGCGTQSVFLTEQLARLGYIVAAPDHADHGCSVDGTSVGLLQVNFEFPFAQFGAASQWTDQTAQYRNADVEAVLSYMQGTWTGKSAINADAIAIAGHSFGGYTAFAKVGGWNSWRNSKFKAGVFYSPYIQAFQAQNPPNLSQATVPQLFMTGGPQDKGIQPWIIGPQPCSGADSENCGQAGAFEQIAATKYYGELPGTGVDASHYAFTNILCANAGEATVQSCLANVPNASAIVNYTQDFLDHFLLSQAPRVLWGTGPEWSVYWQTSGVPTGGFQAGRGAANQQIVSLFGERLTSDDPAAADGATVMPLQIRQTSVTVTDSLSVTRSANLYYVSPSQVNLVIPSGTAAGQAVISVKVSGQLISSGPVTVKAISPSLFTFPGNVLSGWAQNSSGIVPIWTLSGARPLDISDGITYLICLGTGLRNAASVTATIGGVLFDGVHAPLPQMAPSPSFQGLDQVNIGPLPKSLIGTGTVTMNLTADGQTTNSLQVAFK